MTDDTKHGVTAAESAQGANQGIIAGINWTRARDIPFSILGWAAVLFVAFWAAGHIIGTLLVLAIAALIAYALAPVIGILRRWLPWPIAIAIVYLVFVGLLLLLFSVIVDTAIQQAGPLKDRIELLLTAGPTGNSPLIDFAHQLGFTTDQINNVRDALFGQITGAAKDLLPVITGVAGGIVEYGRHAHHQHLFRRQWATCGPLAAFWPAHQYPPTRRLHPRYH